MLNVILAVVDALFRTGIPVKNKLVKGFVFGLYLWAVGMLSRIFSTYAFMTVATGVVIYWTLIGLVKIPLKIIIAAIYWE